MQTELDGIFTPVILGTNLKSLKLAIGLYLKYGVGCHMYDKRLPVLYRAIHFIKFHKIDYNKNDILLLDLDRTAQMYESTLLYLFPMNDQYRTFAANNCATLEDKFVIVKSHLKFTPNGVST